VHGIDDTASKNRVDAPGDAGDSHKERTDGRRCGDAGRDEIDKSGDRDQESEPVQCRRPLSSIEADPDHGDLHGGEENQAPVPAAKVVYAKENVAAYKKSAAGEAQPPLETADSSICRKRAMSHRVAAPVTRRTAV